MKKFDLAFCRYKILRVLTIPMYWIVKIIVLSKKNKLIRHRGIFILDFNSDEKMLFVDKTIEAIEFLFKNDPKRFRRVQRFVKVILISRKGLTRYDHYLHGLWVGFDYVPFKGENICQIQWYAAALVHHATHGVFHSRKIPYTKDNRERIENCCVQEAWRFAGRLSQDEFDWESYIFSEEWTL